MIPKVKNRTPSLLAVLMLLTIEVAVGWIPPVGAEPVAPEVPWESLTFSAAKWFNRVDTHIELSTGDSGLAEASAVESNQGQPLMAAGSELLRIKIRTTIDPTVGSTVVLNKEFWFDPARNNVLFGESRRTGQDEYFRRFRFTRQGVFRFRREPVSSQEALLSPESWSDTKASFYAYNPGQWGCRQILEPSVLIYLINQVNFNSSDQWPAFCVFHKRQLYRVTLEDGGTRIVDVDYQTHSGQASVENEKQIKATRMLLKAVPLGDYKGEVEDFSFLGFKGEVELFFDPSARLPVMISGDIPTLGHSALKLKSARLKR